MVDIAESSIFAKHKVQENYYTAVLYTMIKRHPILTAFPQIQVLLSHIA